MDFICEGALLLKEYRVLTAEQLTEIMKTKYPEILDL
jgi:hypothetical protein